jgi:SlyX protein
MESRIEDLEIRLTHIEAEQEQLTLTVLQQQKAMDAMQARIDYLTSLLKNLAPAAVASREEETPPPHY